ncbi:MAG: OB-fold domain-containing protein [Hyphomicrobiaceae bacterium]
MLRPRPFVGGHDDAPFWEGCRLGVLRLQRCRKSGIYLWPILPVCPDDLTTNFDWVEVSGRGRVSSYVVYRRLYDKEFAGALPYISASVELVEGARMTGNIFSADGDMNADIILGPEPKVDALIGRAVEMFFEDIGGGLRIPQWKLTRDTTSPAPGKGGKTT